jgi:hypothetical protein
MTEATKEGVYVYCIIEGREPTSFGAIGIGGFGHEVYTICNGDLAAVVSNSPMTKYSVSRENTLSHERVIEKVMCEHTVLPVRFGTIAGDEETVKKVLRKEHDRFDMLLQRMRGKKELGLKVIFKKEAIYSDILENYKEISNAKQKIGSLPATKSYYERVKIGQMVEQALENEKETARQTILNVLSPLAVDRRLNEPYGELMIVNAAFLVEVGREAEFDQMVDELAERFVEKMKFKYVGTVPPFNFINLTIELKEN